ncbi:MAG: ABC transporter permease, partial [Gemmatimonadetes bacterium]|nr:ABC transporter permease [Gemmatimonadota bacterium]
MITRALRWLRAVVLRRRLDREMQAEMADHLHRSTERLMARGLSADDARREARREFGNVLFLEEEGRIARGTSGFDAFVADVRFATRHFARHPLSTLTMITVLSVGIAINVVLYTLLHSVADRPPSAVPASADMVRIRGSQLKDGSRIERAVTRDEVEGYANLASQFSAVDAWTSQPVTAAAPGVDDATVTATFVTDSYFDVLGVSALRGRAIAAGDAAQVAVLSHALWTRTFAQDPAILGRTITLADVAFTVIGVAAPKFRGAAWEARDDMQVWVPVESQRRVFPGVSTEVAQFSVIGRLQPGATLDAATAAARVVAARRPTPGVVVADTALALRDPSVEVVPLLADNLEPGAEANMRLVAVAFAALGLL